MSRSSFQSGSTFARTEFSLRDRSAWVLFGLLLTGPQVGWGAPLNKGARAQGMGGAYTAVVNDETALLLNPAGLARLRDTIITALDPEIEISEVTTQSLALGAPATPGNLLGLGAAAANPKNHGQLLRSRITLFPSVATSNFGVGLFYQAQDQAGASALGDQIALSSREDIGLHVGYALKFLEGRIKLGIALKALQRTETSSVSALAGTEFTPTFQTATGFGLGADIGLILALPIRWLPTLSAVLRNGPSGLALGQPGIMSPVLTSAPTDSTLRPNTIATTADIGLAVFPIQSQDSRYAITIESQNALDNLNRTFHAGFEFAYRDLVYLRGGYQHNRPTFGFEIQKGSMQFQYAFFFEPSPFEIQTELMASRHLIKWALRF